MRSKAPYNRIGGNNFKKVNFYSLFEEIAPHSSFFWHPIENSN